MPLAVNFWSRQADKERIKTLPRGSGEPRPVRLQNHISALLAPALLEPRVKEVGLFVLQGGQNGGNPGLVPPAVWDNQGAEGGLPVPAAAGILGKFLRPRGARSQPAPPRKLPELSPVL